MSWYGQMVKSQETARERNRREQRRLQLELDQKHGPGFAAKYRVRELSREQRLVSKELERIRKGVHKPLANEYSASSPIEKREPFKFPEPKLAVTYSREETTLYKAMLFLQNNPSALVPIIDAHSHSQAYVETLQRISPGLTPEPRKPFVPKYLQTDKRKGTSSENNQQLAKYSALLYSQSPILRKNSPLMVRKTSGKVRNSPTTDALRKSPQRPSPLAEIHDSAPRREKHNQTGSVEISESDGIISVSESLRSSSRSHGLLNTASLLERPQHDKIILGHDVQKIETDGGGPETTRSSDIMSLRNFKTEVISTSTPTSGRPRQPLDLLTLADDGIQSARDNIVQRLTGKNMTTKSGMERKTSVTEKHSSAGDENTAEDKTKPLTATKAVMFPTYDPEVYNPDGSLRTVHQLPDFDESYQQARNARYIRSKENLEKERELTIKDIFEKEKK